MLFSCMQAQQPSIGKKILIVYLTRTNNTKAVAQMIQKQTGGVLIGLELEKPYPEDYQATVQQVAEENERDYLPPLKTRIDNMETYDAVFIGFPTWGMKMPPSMKSFLPLAEKMMMYRNLILQKMEPRYPS